MMLPIRLIFAAIMMFAAATAPAPSPDEQQKLAAFAFGSSDRALAEAFDSDRIPDDQQSVYRAIFALHQLETDQTLAAAGRQQILEKAAGDLMRDLSQITEPKILVQTGQLMAAQGVDPQTSIFEYWGRTDADLAAARPIADAAVRIFDQANRLATAQATDLANRITSPDDKLGDAWQKMNDLVGIAAYQKARMQYAFALAMDVADTRRPPIIAEALAALSQWDHPESGIQPQVRFLMAKLHGCQKTPTEAAACRRLADSLLVDPDHQISPAPSPTLLFEVRCYLVTLYVDQSDDAKAAAALADATEDQKANFPDDPEQAATLRLVNYRLLAMRADQAAPADKPAANAAAVQALAQLLHDFPSLRTVIDQQLFQRLGKNIDVTTLDPLLLGAIVDQGRQQVVAAKPGEITDTAQLQMALAAARELVSRYTAGKVTAAQAVDASLLVGVFDEYLGDKFDAVDALLDHIQRFSADPTAKSDFALDQARDLIADMRRTLPVDAHGKLDARIQRLQDRFLPIAIAPPFNRHEFALQYAATLLNQGQYAAAIPFYRMVVDTDSPAQVLTARYGEMVCLKNQLEQPGLPADQQKAILTQFDHLGVAVNKIADQIRASSVSDPEKSRAQATAARAILLAADLNRIQGRDPQQILDGLTDFEARVTGLPDATELLNGALFLRVQSYMQLGRNNDATTTLVQFLDKAGANEGAQTVHDLLAALSKDMQQARASADQAAAHNDAAAKATAESRIDQLAQNRAMLSGFLVQWSAENSDPKIQANAYIYRRFDADAKRTSAELIADPTERQKALAAVLKLYEDLASPAGTQLYQATLDPTQTSTNDPDPIVQLGIGLTAYDLGDYSKVQQSLGPLIHDQKLGENNDAAWEATFKLLDSMHHLVQNGDASVSDAQVAQSIKILYLIWRDGTGGPRWHDSFENLRHKVLPEWQLPPAPPS